MGYMKEKVAYLKGLAEGMNIGEEGQGKLLNAMISTMDEMADAIDENEAAMAEIDECLDDIYDELDNIDDYLSDDEDEDEDEEDDDFVELQCPECGETIYFDEDMLDSEDGLICPNCNEPVEIHVCDGECGCCDEDCGTDDEE